MSLKAFLRSNRLALLSLALGAAVFAAAFAFKDSFALAASARPLGAPERNPPAWLIFAQVWVHWGAVPFLLAVIVATAVLWKGRLLPLLCVHGVLLSACSYVAGWIGAIETGATLWTGVSFHLLLYAGVLMVMWVPLAFMLALRRLMNGSFDRA